MTTAPVAPIARASIIWGKCLGGAIVATGQSLILLALVGTVGIPYDPLLLTALGVLLSTRIKTIQAAMPISQLLIMPMMFLSGSLFPLGGLPAWLSIVTRLNPLTYVVQPMRHLVLAHLDLSATEQARLLPAITWGGWAVPIGLQLLTVAVITVALIGLGARLFRTSE